MELQTTIQRYEPFYKKSLLLVFGIYLAFIQLATAYSYIHLLPLPMPALLTLGTGFLFFVYSVLYLEKKPSQIFEAERIMKLFVKFFSIAIGLAILSALYTLNVVYSVEYEKYVRVSMITRLLYYAAFVVLLVYGYKMISRFEPTKILKVIRIYPISVYLLLLVGVWQLMYFMWDVPFIDLKTRSYIHSVTGVSFFNFRLTSFADEPSYLGPILIDMLILGYLTFRKKWMYVLFVAIPALLLLVFSFSVSAYLNLVAVAAFLVVYLMFQPKFPKKYIWMLLGAGVLVIIAVLILKPGIFIKFFSPIIGRMGGLFNSKTSSRIYMYIMPFHWLFDHSFISALFGYGPGSFDFLHATKILPNKVAIATSSNNMYIDLLFETGILGFLLILSTLIYVLKTLLKKGTKNIYYFIALIEFVHLLVTSSYRADFVTPRFWSVFLIVFLLMRIGEGKEAENSSDGVNNFEN